MGFQGGVSRLVVVILNPSEEGHLENFSCFEDSSAKDAWSRASREWTWCRGPSFICVGIMPDIGQHLDLLHVRSLDMCL